MFLLYADLFEVFEIKKGYLAIFTGELLSGGAVANYYGSIPIKKAGFRIKPTAEGVHAWGIIYKLDHTGETFGAEAVLCLGEGYSVAGCNW